MTEPASFERAVDPSKRAGRAGSLAVAVLGGGNGGLAMAGHLSLLGYETRIWSPFSWELRPIEERGGIEIVGPEVSGFATLAGVARSVDEAVRPADLIMVVAPASAHRPYASILAPLLRDGQRVVLNPGRTGGALEFARTLVRFACSARVVLGETQTLVYAAERRGPATVEIMKEKFRVRAAALPSKENDAFLEYLRDPYPQMEAAESVLETGLNNVGPVVHPATVMLNTHVIERAAAGEDLRFYRDQVTRSIATLVMENLDRERQQVARGLGVRDVWSLLDWYRESYHLAGSNVYETVTTNPYYEGFSASTHLLAQNHILDEVPNSLVPMAQLGRAAGVPTPTMDALISLAEAMTGIDWRGEGRTVERLGLAGMTPEEMAERVERTPWAGRAGETGVCRTFDFYR